MRSSSQMTPSLSMTTAVTLWHCHLLSWFTRRKLKGKLSKKWWGWGKGLTPLPVCFSWFCWMLSGQCRKKPFFFKESRTLLLLLCHKLVRWWYSKGVKSYNTSENAFSRPHTIREAIHQEKCSLFEHCSNGGGQTHVQKLCRKLSCVLEVI